MESKPVIIGIDHGYAAMKTAHCSFPSGLVAYEHPPYSMKDVLVYQGKYYVVGSGRQPLQQDKTKSENYYLLTLAAMAKELGFRKAETNTEVILAVGLPLTSFGREMSAFRRYLLRDGKPISFFFSEKAYSITIRDVKVFPQGYSAVLMQRELLEEPSVIVADIGGWTVDLMQIDNRITNAATCRSLDLGVIRCVDEITEQVRRTQGYTLTSSQIEKALCGDTEHLEPCVTEIVNREAEKYVMKVLASIQESGMDYRAMPVIFLGGGANLLKRHVPNRVGLCRPFIQEDDKLNARGFERLCAQMSGREGNG